MEGHSIKYKPIKATIPSLFTYQCGLCYFRRHECKAGSVSAGFSRYMTWKTADGNKEASRFTPQLEVL
jgi:type I restriction enzyme R subunit